MGLNSTKILAQLITVNVSAAACDIYEDKSNIARTRRQTPVSHQSKFAERLLAHARLYRQIAGEAWNEETAKELEQLAEECQRAAENVDAEDASNDEPDAPMH